MLRVKSFKISDDTGINDLLSKFRLASGAHILVSEGHLCIPYEDGNPPTNDQQRVAISEQKNTMLEQKSIIAHSQLVLDHLVADAKEREAVAEQKLKNDPTNQVLKKSLAEARSAREQTENQKLLNKGEIARLDFNVEQYDKQIAKLS